MTSDGSWNRGSCDILQEAGGCVWSQAMGRDMFQFAAAFGQNDLAAMRNSTSPRLKCQGADAFSILESQFAAPAGGYSQ
jgi:hypothetical protein